jgi:hypothetical protein
MRDLTKRGATAVPPRLPKGLAFEIADLVLIKGWADCHNFHMSVRLDHGAAVDEEYEEVITFQTEISPLYRLIMWRNAAAVFVQPLVGRGKRYDSVGDALKSLAQLRLYKRNKQQSSGLRPVDRDCPDIGVLPSTL